MEMSSHSNFVTLLPSSPSPSPSNFHQTSRFTSKSPSQLDSPSPCALDDFDFSPFPTFKSFPVHDLPLSPTSSDILFQSLQQHDPPQNIFSSNVSASHLNQKLSSSSFSLHHSDLDQKEVASQSNVKLDTDRNEYTKKDETQNISIPDHCHQQDQSASSKKHDFSSKESHIHHSDPLFENIQTPSTIPLPKSLSEPRQIPVVIPSNMALPVISNMKNDDSPNNQSSPHTPILPRAAQISKEQVPLPVISLKNSKKRRNGGRWSHLPPEELKRLRRLRNRESVEKCRTKQRLKIEALQVEKVCLTNANASMQNCIDDVATIAPKFHQQCQTILHDTKLNQKEEQETE